NVTYTLYLNRFCLLRKLINIPTRRSSDLHIPKKKRKAFSNPVGMKPSLIKEAPLPNIERKMKSNPNNSYCKAFAAFVLLFLFLFFLANGSTSLQINFHLLKSASYGYTSVSLDVACSRFNYL